MATLINTKPAMTPQETARFEAYARSQGYNTTKEGNRYCQGVVNALRDAWIEALKEGQ